MPRKIDKNEDTVVRITIFADKESLLFIALAIINETVAVGAVSKTKMIPKAYPLNPINTATTVKIRGEMKVFIAVARKRGNLFLNSREFPNMAPMLINAKGVARPAMERRLESKKLGKAKCRLLKPIPRTMLIIKGFLMTSSIVFLKFS